MRVVISAEGDNEPKGQHYMVVDGVGFLIDLSKVVGTLVDPTISKVEWGVVTRNGEQREGGTIFRRDGGRQTFFDQSLLKPYLDAYQARKGALMSLQPAPKP